MKKMYIKTTKSPYGALVLFEDKNNNTKWCHLCFLGVNFGYFLMESTLCLKIMKKKD